MIGIIDYGMGNLRSVHNAFGRLGYHSEVVDEREVADRYERLVLPGVGSFARAMHNLDTLGWSDYLREVSSEGRPLLGICLGMQLLFERGSEHGDTPGLGLLRGRVELMTVEPPHKIPHVGWNGLIYARPHALFEGVKEHVDFYFVHSYECIAEDPDTVVATCGHGGEFVACVARKNVVGMQFHPEKSQPLGLTVLKNFAGWNRSEEC